MNDTLVWKEIQDYTIQHSGFEEKRDYVSLSRISKNAEDLVKEFISGYYSNDNSRLKCYKGYQMEADMKRRLKIIFGSEISFDPEISIEGGLFKGHPDFILREKPGEFKSVLMDDWLPWDKKINPSHYFQMQAYLLYLKREDGIFIYESRESGQIVSVLCRENKQTQRIIEEKIGRIKELLKLQGFVK